MDVVQLSRIVQEEIFGFVLMIQMFRMIDEVIQKVNNLLYGFVVGVWIDKGLWIFNLIIKLCVGVVWVNMYNKFDFILFFGGYKESGFGCEGGLQGLGVYLKME